MPGFQYVRTSTNNQSPHRLAYTLGKSYASSTAKGLVMAGDIVVLTTNSNHTTSSYPVVRPLVAADKTAHYQQGTPIAGLLGVAEMSAQTDTNGFASAPVTPANLAASAIPIYALPTVPSGFDVDPNIGYSRIVISLFDQNNEFKANLNSGTTSGALNGTQAGLILATSGTNSTYTIDTAPSGGAIAGGDACLLITKWDERDPSQKAVYVKCHPSFQQGNTGVNYTTAG
jgi:hypothetical protein